MVTGPETLATIDQSLQRLRQQLEEADGQLQTASKRLMQLQQTATQRFRELAKLRLDRLLSGQVANALDDVDRRIEVALAAREQELAELERQIAESQRLQTQLEHDREAQRQRVNEAIHALDTAQAKTQQRLDADPAYRAKLEKTRQADAIAGEAEAKTQQAEADRAAKGAPYEADPLFMYLWRRGYGTSAYRANPLSRFLDGWVARLCNYHDARPNYYMLLEIPLRLREHARQVRENADERLKPLRQQEQAAAEADGIPQLAEAAQKEQQSLAELDARIKEAEQSYRQLAEQRAAYVAGKDENFRQCLESMALELQREPLLSLRRHAAATPTPKDDLIVQELGNFDFQKTEFAQSLERHQQVYDRHLARMKELEDVRHRFKQHDYDDYGSLFTNEDDILAMLNEFLRGLASGDDVWGVLRGNHRRRMESDPTFGSGGIRIELPGGGFEFPRGGFPIPFPRGGFELPIPIPRGGGFEFPGGGSWRLPSPPVGGPWFGPGSGGDGFRTTGGF